MTAVWVSIALGSVGTQDGLLGYLLAGLYLVGIVGGLWTLWSMRREFRRQDRENE